MKKTKLLGFASCSLMTKNNRIRLDACLVGGRLFFRPVTDSTQKKRARPQWIGSLFVFVRLSDNQNRIVMVTEDRFSN